MPEEYEQLYVMQERQYFVTITMARLDTSVTSKFLVYMYVYG